MNDDKVYTPETIQDAPFPVQSQTASFAPSQVTTNQTYQPTTVQDQPFPVKRMADELINNNLNTLSRKILGEFQFTPSGALQIGTYQSGVNGDIRISPAGIVARNTLGDTTFVLNGETGDASFKGDVQANNFFVTGGSIIATAIESHQQQGFSDLQEAINWINNAGGGQITLPSGVFPISANITLYSNVTISGLGQADTILDFQNTTFNISAIGTLATRLTDIHISNLQIRNCRNVTTGAVYFSLVNDSSVTDCSFHNNWDGSDGRDIYFNTNTCNRIDIMRNKSYSGGYFFNGGGNNINIIANYISSCNKSAIFGDTFAVIASIIYGNYIDHPVETAIYHGSNGTQTIIQSNNIIAPGSDGIFTNSGLVRIVDNMLDMVNQGGHGIHLNGSTGFCIIEGNIIYRIDGTNTRSGVYLEASCDRDIMSGNMLYGSGETGDIGITISASTCDNNIITGNVFFNLSTTISDSGTGTVSANNTT